MKDVKSFCKLFDLNVPSYDDFDYYRKLYARIGRHSDIDELVSMYEQLEDGIDDMFEYRMQCTKRLVEYIEGTRAFNDLNLDPMVPDLSVNKSYEFSEGKYYVSFDIRKANWRAVKSYDPEFLNEFGNSWEELIERLGIPPLFARSKQLRQYVFGNLNPKRLMKVQRRMVEVLADRILSTFQMKADCVRHDELIFCLDTIESAVTLADTFADVVFRSKIFTVDVHDGFRVNKYVDTNGEVYDREPVGCNGHRYFMTLKLHVFDEPLDVRDLYFRMDGELAVWKVPGLETKLNN